MARFRQLRLLSLPLGTAVPIGSAAAVTAPTIQLVSLAIAQRRACERVIAVRDMSLKGIDSKFKWLQGLDLNQRPLGYEPKLY